MGYNFFLFIFVTRTDQNSMDIFEHIRSNANSSSLKYIQLVDSIINAINEGTLNEGDMLPSVNELVKNASLSRDTIFKAYSELKNRGVIESVPNRGYFVTRNHNKVLLFLDTFKAYKEVLYEGFRSNLPENYSVDLHFHHYNIKVFETILNDSIGRYTHYIVMCFDHPLMKQVIEKIPAERLLVIDWNIHTNENHSYVCQDFGYALYNNLSEHHLRIKDYQQFIYLYPEKMTYHPKESVQNFKKFCTKNKLNARVITDTKKLELNKGDLYLLVSDRTLAMILDQASEKKLEPGRDFGIISYNETPMKRYVKDGITVISTDFVQMGRMAAEYVLNPGPIKYVVPTTMILRKSF